MLDEEIRTLTGHIPVRFLMPVQCSPSLAKASIYAVDHRFTRYKQVEFTMPLAHAVLVVFPELRA